MLTTNLAKYALGASRSGLLAKFHNLVPSFLEIKHKSEQKVVAKSVASNGKASNAFVCSDASRVVMERVREARGLGKPLKFGQGDNPLLQQCLDNTPLDLCRDKEWENMRDVGKEIVD